MKRRGERPSRLWDAERGRVARLLERVRAAAAIRADRVRHRLSPPRSTDRHTGPVFPVSGFDATFDELARIVNHPAVRAQILGEPDISAAPATEPPSFEWPSGHDRFSLRRRDHPAPVYDLVPFAFELDMLELRLLTLGPVVDRFIVVESAAGYGGIDKGVRFDPAAPRFARFRDRITHLVVPAEVVDSQYPDGRRRSKSAR